MIPTLFFQRFAIDCRALFYLCTLVYISGFTMKLEKYIGKAVRHGGDNS